jgi:hypothetical protein
MRASILVGLGALIVCVSAGCGSDAKKNDAKATKAEPTKSEDEKAEKTKDPAPTPDEALHFDITKDQSGVLARAASTLETTELLDEDLPLREHLAELSHHAERQPSNELLCRKMISLKGEKALTLDVCARLIEHQRVRLGPEVFAEMAACVTHSKTAADIARCEEAEQEAERLLRENKHGDGIDRETCEKLFIHFEALAMADAGEHGKLVEEVLEEVRDDIIEACLDHGTKDEIECAMKATDMETLGKCESSLM